MTEKTKIPYVGFRLNAFWQFVGEVDGHLAEGFFAAADLKEAIREFEKGVPPLLAAWNIVDARRGARREAMAREEISFRMEKGNMSLWRRLMSRIGF